MKKLFAIVLAVLILVGTLSSCSKLDFLPDKLFPNKDQADVQSEISKGLSFELSSDNSYYILSGIGTCTDTKINIPSTYNGKPVKEIKLSAFYNNDKIIKVKIPDSVTSIGSNAFAYCDSLVSVTIGNGVTSIGSYAFYDCKSLTNITVNSNNLTYQSIDGNLYSKNGKTLIQYAIGKTDESFTIPSSVTSIGSDAFAYCDSLTSIIIPDSVTSIGSSAFSYCDRLTSIIIPDSVTSIGSSAFKNCDSLTSVTIGNGVTSIGDFAFLGCTKLSGTTYNNAIYLGNSNNPYLYLLKAVNKNITSVTVNQNTKFIGSSAFSSCDSLTSVTIGNSVTSIGTSAFYHCYSLTRVTFKNTSGWKADSTSISSTDLANTSTAAMYLTSTYSWREWTRS